MHVPLSLLDVLTIVSDSLITGHIYSIINCVHKLADAYYIATYIAKHNVDTHTVFICIEAWASIFYK